MGRDDMTVKTFCVADDSVVLVVSKNIVKRKQEEILVNLYFYFK